MVNLIEDWDVLEEYAGEKLGFYQKLVVDGKTEIRVMTGRPGFRRDFADGNDKLLIHIQEFSSNRGCLMTQAPKVRFIHILLGLFGPPVDIPGLGQCIMIMDPQFNRDWKKTLYNQGFSCHFENLDDYPAVFVPVKPSLEVLH